MLHVLGSIFWGFIAIVFLVWLFVFSR